MIGQAFSKGGINSRSKNQHLLGILNGSGRDESDNVNEDHIAQDDNEFKGTKSSKAHNIRGLKQLNIFQSEIISSGVGKTGKIDGLLESERGSVEEEKEIRHSKKLSISPSGTSSSASSHSLISGYYPRDVDKEDVCSNMDVARSCVTHESRLNFSNFDLPWKFPMNGVADGDVNQLSRDFDISSVEVTSRTGPDAHGRRVKSNHETGRKPVLYSKTAGTNVLDIFSRAKKDGRSRLKAIDSYGYGGLSTGISDAQKYRDQENENIEDAEQYEYSKEEYDDGMKNLNIRDIRNTFSQFERVLTNKENISDEYKLHGSKTIDGEAKAELRSQYTTPTKRIISGYDDDNLTMPKSVKLGSRFGIVPVYDEPHVPKKEQSHPTQDMVYDDIYGDVEDTGAHDQVKEIKQMVLPRSAIAKVLESKNLTNNFGDSTIDSLERIVIDSEGEMKNSELQKAQEDGEDDSFSSILNLSKIYEGLINEDELETIKRIHERLNKAKARAGSKIDSTGKKSASIPISGDAGLATESKISYLGNTSLMGSHECEVCTKPFKCMCMGILRWFIDLSPQSVGEGVKFGRHKFRVTRFGVFTIVLMVLYGVNVVFFSLGVDRAGSEFSTFPFCIPVAFSPVIRFFDALLVRLLESLTGVDIFYSEWMSGSGLNPYSYGMGYPPPKPTIIDEWRTGQYLGRKLCKSSAVVR